MLQKRLFSCSYLGILDLGINPVCVEIGSEMHGSCLEFVTLTQTATIRVPHEMVNGTGFISLANHGGHLCPEKMIEASRSLKVRHPEM